MNKLIKNVAVILGLSLIGFTTTNAGYALAKDGTVKSLGKKPGEICYWFNSQGLLGEWKEDLLVSKKKLTIKQAHAYMQSNYGISDIYDAEQLPDDECDGAIVSWEGDPEYVHYYKEPVAAKAPAKATETKPKTQAQPVKKTTTTTK